VTAPPVWTATLLLQLPSEEAAQRLEAALRPEAAREVPRARARIERPSARAVRLAIDANDTGALRAALNTYLGWVTLAQATEAAAAQE
jgi:tRNA threonylcarbamoyladenosine modification (KEOPS) complex  Pcc1 subunit